VRAWDADTHVNPAAEVLDRYVDPGFRPRLAELAPYRMVSNQIGGTPGTHQYRVDTKLYRRILGEAGPHETFTGRGTKWMGSKQPRVGVQDDQAANRVADMDDEGVDGHLMVPTGWGKRRRAAEHGARDQPDPRVGQATARILRESSWRVVLMASSSWSHAFLTEKNHFLYPDLVADRILLEQLRAGDYESWRNLPLAQLEASGQHEVLNWVCLAGAMAEVGAKMELVDWVETWMFNAPKCQAVFR
jgi:hypothetical protein